MNYKEAEKRLSEMQEKDDLSDDDYEILNDITKSDDMCLKCDAADILIDHTANQAVEILKMLSNDNDATVRASAYDNMCLKNRILMRYSEMLLPTKRTELQEAMLYFPYMTCIRKTSVIPPNLLLLCTSFIRQRKTENVNFNISEIFIFREKPTSSVRSSHILKMKITQ